MNGSAASNTDDFDLKLLEPGFTPSVRVVPQLIERIGGGDERLAQAAARALIRVQAPIVDRTRALFDGLAARAQQSVLRALGGRVGGTEDAALGALFVAALTSPSEGVRVAAARGLSKLRRADSVAALDAALARASSSREKEALSAALALSGGVVAPAPAERSAGPSTALDKARLIAERDVLRASPARGLDLALRLPARTRVVFHCRRGLEAIVQGELRERLGAPGARATAEPERVTIDWSGPIAELAAVRVALGFGFCFAGERAPSENDAHVVSRMLGDRSLSALVRSLTPGVARFRLAWAGGGKKRSLTWQVARDVRAHNASLVNDPTDSDWEVRVRIDGDRVALDLVPRWLDERFAYRSGDVPASSHPTIAAALARVAGADERDVVWDPFVGSGLELCERALRGGYRALVGTDIDPRAIAVARTNLDAVGARAAELRQEDARRCTIEGLSCLLTNPPMGRRVLRGEDVARLLGDVIRQAARQLTPGGRVVLLSPHPMSTARVAGECGLAQSLDQRVDLGGFDAVLQRFDSKT